MNVLFHVILFPFQFKEISSYLNQNELKLSLSLVQELDIRQCVLVGNNKNFISVMKKFSSANIPTMGLDPSRLIAYVNNADEGYFHTGIILKDLLTLKQISRILEKVIIKF